MINKKVIKEILKEYKEKYPTVKEITVDYQGSGDSFDDFWNFSFEYTEENPIELDEKEVGDAIFNSLDEAIWKLIDNLGADFNNDGCRGTIFINLENLDLRGDIYENYTEERFAGEDGFFDGE